LQKRVLLLTCSSGSDLQTTYKFGVEMTKKMSVLFIEKRNQKGLSPRISAL